MGKRDATPADLQRKGRDTQALEKGGYIGKHRKPDPLDDVSLWLRDDGGDDG